MRLARALGRAFSFSSVSAIAALGAVIWATSTASAQAESAPPADPTQKAAVEDNRSLSWLMHEPVTLLDLGMMRLRSDLTAIAEGLYAAGVAATPPRVGTYYEWREQRIVAYMTVRELTAQPSVGVCKALFQRVTRDLVEKAPGGTRQASWYLDGIFAHEGPGNYTKPRSMSRDLLRAVTFEVGVLPPDPMRDSRKVQCAGQLDAEADDLTLTVS